MFKKFLRLSSENKSSVLCLSALLMFTVWLALYLFGVSNLGTKILAMSAGILLSVGCAFMCHAAADIQESGAKPMIIGAYGVVGLISFEATLSTAFSQFGVTLPAVTAYYAVPLVVLFFYGLGKLVFTEIIRSWRWRAA